MTETSYRINFFIQTVASQMLWYLNDHDDAIRLATTFTVLLPLGGAIGIPPVGKLSAARADIRMIYGHIGVLLDRGGIFVASLVVLLMGILFGIFGMIRSYSAQLLSISMLVLLRPLMYTFGEPFYSIPLGPANIHLTVGDYCAKSGHSTLTGVFFSSPFPQSVWLQNIRNRLRLSKHHCRSIWSHPSPNRCAAQVKATW